MKFTIDQIAGEIHKHAKQNGFYPVEVKDITASRIIRISLIICELSEAIEALRKNNIYGDLGEGSYYEEIIDALMRMLDLIESEKLNIEGRIADKIAYNAKRGEKHGKEF